MEGRCQVLPASDPTHDGGLDEIQSFCTYIIHLKDLSIKFTLLVGGLTRSTKSLRPPTAEISKNKLFGFVIKF